jgi:DNA-binding MarR family transcriptional regulator
VAKAARRLQIAYDGVRAEHGAAAFVRGAAALARGAAALEHDARLTHEQPVRTHSPMSSDDDTLTAVRGEAEQRAFDFNKYLPYHLTFPVAVVSRVLGGTMESRFGLRTTHWRIMALLGSPRPVSTRDLSRYLSSERSAISRATSELIARGYVLRIIHPRDRRLLMLQLSAAGKKLFESMSEVALEFQAALIRNVSRHELMIADQVLKKLRDAALEYRAHQLKPKSQRRLSRTQRRASGVRRESGGIRAPRRAGRRGTSGMA